MRAVIQRVNEATVRIDGKVVGQIGQGLLILAGFEADDVEEDVEWLSRKIIRLRIFSDENGLMNRSVQEVDGGLLVVSQFTLHASTKKGNRPSYIRSAAPDVAEPLFEKFIALLEKETQKVVQKGQFGANMKVSLLNDGPVTIFIDTKNKE